ncbi:DUF1003 domain-containing protein [Halotia wernerae UHCC 0503]|nr:DUF1003 domain-containing protein [Halotia wernerae UHCC 0503]
MNNASNETSTSNTTEFELRTSHNRVLTAPLPDPISKSIETIALLHRQEVRDIPTHQRVLENISAFFGRPAFLYSLLAGIAFWIFGSMLNKTGIVPFNLPSFSLSNQGLDTAALLISTGVLVRQSRQENFAKQRAQLSLQLNLISEQKIAKVIALLEELRKDLPNVNNRDDHEAQVMEEAADPMVVLSALQENLAEILASDAETRFESVIDSPSSEQTEKTIVNETSMRRQK